MNPAYKTDRRFALEMDDADSLSDYHRHFHIPQHEGRDAVYLCGNSLGLQPRTVKPLIDQELNDWATFGVEGHFLAKRPWFAYHHFFTDSLCRLTGARPTEVVAMNTLTVNLHLLMISFYRPTKQRYKIIMEAGAFPSDQYAIESQVCMHGLQPDKAIIELHPREGEYTLRTEDIEATIKKHGKQLALVLMGGVNYYTGQYFDLERITRAAHATGALAGFDLAHAIGNKALHLHDWKVDFACWCSYKYLNSGPGAVGGLYVRDDHARNPNTPRLSGWWGYDEKTRFKMKKGFKPMKSAESWQMSNAQVFNMAAHRASLDLFDTVDMSTLAQKSYALTGYLEFLLKQLSHLRFRIITPENPLERGCQLSLLFSSKGKAVFDYLQQHGVLADWREPNVIRMSPVPLYNSFQDVYAVYEVLQGFR